MFKILISFIYMMCIVYSMLTLLNTIQWIGYLFTNKVIKPKYLNIDMWIMGLLIALYEYLLLTQL